MKRINLRLLINSLLALSAFAAHAQQQPASLSLSPDGIDHVTVYTDRVESGPSGDVVIFRGLTQPVRAEIYQGRTDTKLTGPIVLTGNTVTVDYGAGVVTAQDAVTVQWEDHLATGVSAQYNWTKRTGHIDDVRFTEDGVTFHASSLELQPNRRLMRDATFSGCGLENPDYVVHAKTVSLGNNRRISARRVGLELFHTRIVTLPLLSYRVKPAKGGGSQGLPVPRPGSSEVSGFSLSQDIPISDNADIEVQATTRVGWRGVIRYANEGRITPYIEADWKQERPSRGRVPVLVSRLPEAGLRFGEGNSVTLSIGDYREHSSGVRARRETLSLERTLLDHGKAPGLRLIVGARDSVYSTSDEYRTARADLSFGRETQDRDTFEEIGTRLNALYGHTPFEWDQVQVQTEAYLGRRIAWGHYRMEVDLRYDVGHREMYEVEVGLAKVLRCVEPEIRYSDRRKAIVLTARLVR